MQNATYGDSVGEAVGDFVGNNVGLSVLFVWVFAYTIDQIDAHSLPKKVILNSR